MLTRPIARPRPQTVLAVMHTVEPPPRCSTACVCWRAPVEQSDSSRLRLLLACRPCRLVPTAHCRVIVHRIDKRRLLRVGAQGEQPWREVAHSLRRYSLKSIANPRGKGRCTQRYLFSGRSSRLHSAGARGEEERCDACVRTTRRRRGTREGEYRERVGHVSLRSGFCLYCALLTIFCTETREHAVSQQQPSPPLARISDSPILKKKALLVSLSHARDSIRMGLTH